MLAHGNHLRNNGFFRPLNTKDLCEFPQVRSSGLADRENGVTKPSHAEIAQLLIKEFDS